MASAQNQQGGGAMRPPKPEILDEKKTQALVKSAQGRFLSTSRKNPEALKPAWARESSFATQIILKSEALRKAEHTSLVNAVINLASVGLTFNPIKQHATIVPRWNKDINGYEGHLMVMYRGLIYLGTQAGVTDIVAEVVYELDDFAFKRTDQGDIYTHVINVKNERGTETNPFVGVYVAARMPSGRIKVEWVPADDIYQMRDQSDAYWLWDWKNDRRYKTDKPDPESGWVRWFDEYAKKSGIKRAQKRWEEAMQEDSKWTRFRRAVELDNKAEQMRFTRKERDGADEAEVVVPPLKDEQVQEIMKQVGAMKLRDPDRFIHNVCDVYGVKSLSEIPNTKYNEVLERLEESRKAAAARRATS